MNNKEKYDDVFVRCLEIEQKDLKDDLTYNTIDNWDSIGHMGLIGELEEVFDIMMETDDIIDFSSYGEGKKILKKYEIEIL